MGKYKKKFKCQPVYLDSWTSEEIEDEQDGLGLVGLLQAITFQQDGSKIGMLSLVEATKNLYFCFQRKEWTLDGYATEFKA